MCVCVTIISIHYYFGIISSSIFNEYISVSSPSITFSNAFDFFKMEYMEVFGVKTDKMAINYNYRYYCGCPQKRPPIIFFLLIHHLKTNLFAWQIDENTQLVTFIIHFIFLLQMKIYNNRKFYYCFYGFGILGFKKLQNINFFLNIHGPFHLNKQKCHALFTT